MLYPGFAYTPWVKQRHKGGCEIQKYVRIKSLVSMLTGFAVAIILALLSVDLAGIRDTFLLNFLPHLARSPPHVPDAHCNPHSTIGPVGKTLALIPPITHMFIGTLNRLYWEEPSSIPSPSSLLNLGDSGSSRHDFIRTYRLHENC